MIEEYIELFKELAANPVFQDWGIVGLFINSLLSATALPLPTEILTTSLLAGGESEILVGLILVLGSSIGGLLNYWIGFGGNKLFRRFKKREVTFAEQEKEKKGHKYLSKLGWAGVFFAPFILVAGDLILISAGAKKMNFKKFIVLMIGGKTLKAVVTVLGIGVIF